MKRNLLSIGKMAEMNQVTVPTLRLYDQLGLLRPRHVDGETGYRYYDINQNARLDMIAYMKELGMSLKEIQGVLEAEDIALIEQILARKNEQIHQQIRDLRLRHNAVERAIASIATANLPPRAPSRWNTSTGATSGAFPARKTFMKRISPPMNRR